MFTSIRNVVVQAHADAARFDDELVDLVLEQPLAVARASLGLLRNGGADAGAHLEPALLDQVLDDTWDRTVQVCLRQL